MKDIDMRHEFCSAALCSSILTLYSLSACVSSSIGADVSAVRKLSRARELPHVREGDVEANTAEEVRALLKKPIDADAAVRVALLNNRELRARLHELGVARANVMQASMIANPTLEIDLLPERDSDVEVRAEYEITSLLMAPMKKRAEERELEALRFEVAGAVVELGYEVRTAFYALQAAEQRLALAQQTLDALAAGRDTATALLAAGNIPELSAATQIAGYERARITVAQVELTVLELREATQRLLGLHGDDTEWQVAATLSSAPEELKSLEKLEVLVLDANLDLRAMQKRLDALAKRTGIARTQGYLPHVAVDVHSLHTDPEVAGAGSEWRWGTGLTIEVPLFDRSQGELRGYEAQFDALLQRYQGLAIDLRSSAREAYSRLASAHARAKHYEKVIVPAQQTVTQQTLLQYNAMQLSVFELLQAQREQLDVQLGYVDTLREYWSARAELDALLDGRLVKGAATRGSSAPTPSGASRGGH